MRAESCPTLCDSMDCCPPGSSVRGIFQERNAGVGCHFLDLRNPGIQPTSPVSPALADEFFTTVLPGKPVNRASDCSSSSSWCQGCMCLEILCRPLWRWQHTIPCCAGEDEGRREGREGEGEGGRGRKGRRDRMKDRHQGALGF